MGGTVFLPRQGPGALTFGRPVPALGALGGEWEDWCDTAGGRAYYGGDDQGYKICIRDFFGGGLVPGEPWTDIGRQLRWAASGFLPGLDEYDPEKLLILTWVNPVRFNHLMLMAQFVPGLSEYMTTGAWIPLAFANANARGGAQYVWDTLVMPALKDGSKFALNVIFKGPVMSFAIKILESQRDDPDATELVRGMAKVLLDNIVHVQGVLDYGVDYLRKAGVIRTIGDNLRKLDAADPAFSAISGVGAALYWYGDAVTAFIMKDEDVEPKDQWDVEPPQKNSVMQQRFYNALDAVMYGLFQVTYTSIKLGVSDIRKLAATRNAGARQVLLLLREGAVAIRNAFGKLIPGPFELIDEILGPLIGLVDTVEEIDKQVDRQASQVAVGGEGFATGSQGLTYGSDQLPPDNLRPSASLPPSVTPGTSLRILPGGPTVIGRTIIIGTPSTGSTSAPAKVAATVTATGLKVEAGGVSAFLTSQPPSTPSGKPKPTAQTIPGGVKAAGGELQAPKQEIPRTQPPPGAKSSLGPVLVVGAVLVAGAGYWVLRRRVRLTAPQLGGMRGRRR